MNQYKKRAFRVIFLIIFFVAPTRVFSQSNLFNFFKYKGLETISFYAHPTNTRIVGRSIVNDYKNWVDIGIRYKEAITILRIYKGGFPLYFKEIEVLNDDDDFPAFVAVGLFKNSVLEIYKNSDEYKRQRVKSALENYYMTKFENMNGKELALLALNLEYIDY